jgi:lysophospholipase L1-like esterase
VFVDYEYTTQIKWPLQESQASLVPKARAKLVRGDTLTVAAFGDSITAGGEATAPELIFWNRWADSLKKKYPRAKINMINSATGGDTTVQGLERLEEKVISKKPDLVLVAFGMNDQNKGFVTEEQFEANLGLIVDRIRRGTSAEIILISSFPPNPNWHWTSGQMEEYSRITGRVAKAKNCAFADVYPNWVAYEKRKKPEDLLANNVNHPNDFGHWIYFRVLEQLGL